MSPSLDLLERYDVARRKYPGWAFLMQDDRDPARGWLIREVGRVGFVHLPFPWSDHERHLARLLWQGVSVAVTTPLADELPAPARLALEG
ncbi:MAG: hypothetical protein AMXMBFR7_16280 [Planctomycetota bacterium]